MSGESHGIEAKVRTLAEPALLRAGYELVDLEYRREPGGWTLRLFIDKPGGVSLEDCTRVSHEVGPLLEVEDPIPHHYNLEVSSPGLDRPLKKPSDFVAATGRLVRVSLREAIGGRRNFTGRLVRAGDDPAASASDAGTGAGGEFSLQIRDETGMDHLIGAGDIDRARLIHEWPEVAGRTPKGSQKPGRASGRKR